MVVAPDDFIIDILQEAPYSDFKRAKCAQNTFITSLEINNVAFTKESNANAFAFTHIVGSKGCKAVHS